MITTQI